ncbi:hypothetical protein YC2023_072587 [Brassica napus]
MLWPHSHAIANHFPIGHPSFHYSSSSTLNSGVLSGCAPEKSATSSLRPTTGLKTPLRSELRWLTSSDTTCSKSLFTDPAITTRAFPMLWPHSYAIANHFPIGHPSFHYSSSSTLNSGVLSGCAPEKTLSKDFKEVQTTSRKSRRLPGSPDDFQEVQTTSRKSRRLPESPDDFQEVQTTSRKSRRLKWKSSGRLPGSRLVHSHVDAFNFTDNKCCDRFDTPKEMANSHFGIVTDGRYAPATPIWRGRLHVVQGSKENRNAVAYDHWSIAVKDGKALDEWRKEVPIPRGGPQRFLYLLQSHLLCFEPYALLQSHR